MGYEPTVIAEFSAKTLAKFHNRFRRFIMRRSSIIIEIVILSLLLLNTEAYTELYNRAPDVLPGTIPEMHDPVFWIARMEKPDETILSPEAIQRMNVEYQKKINAPNPFKGAVKERIPNLSHWWPGYEMVIPDLYAMKPKDIADTVRVKIKNEVEYLRSREFGNALAVKYSDWEIDAFENEMALDLVPDDIKIRSGIAVRTTRLRNVPSYSNLQVGLWENAKTRWDMFTVCMLKIGKPLTVLHRSRNGEHLFVLCGEGYGWVRSEDVAFSDKKDIDEFINSERFVVCTGDRVIFYSDESCTYASGWFGMGDSLPLTESSNTREIKKPVRKSNGQFAAETVWLAEDADVSNGWLPYTRRNIVKTAFKLLDNPYDWTGGWFGRNHETTYRDIFACFGFELPFHGVLFTHFGHNEKVALPGTGKKEQYKIILGNEPFVTLQSVGGHAQLLLGEYNGEPIVLDQHGYGYKDEDGTEIEVRRCCIGDMRMPAYFLKRPITFLEMK